MDLQTLLPTIGYFGIFAIVFAESGLLVGFFLPGDSLLFTAGFLASQGIFNIGLLALGCFIAAVVGDSVGYRKESILFHKDNLIKAENFYEKHGRKTIIVARFLPVVRTFAPIVAGIGKMEYRTFISFNIIGGFLWSVGLTIAGYVLGSVVPNVDKYLLPIIILIIILSVLPQIIHLLKDKDSRKQIIAFIKARIS